MVKEEPKKTAQKGIFEKMMEKLTLSWKLLFIFPLCFFLLLVSCSPQASRSNYRDSAFSADLVYLRNDIRICASVLIGSPRDATDPLPRDLTLHLSFPEALQGLVIQRIDGVLFFSYKELSKTVEHSDLLRCTDLLLSEDESLNYYFDSSTELPLEIHSTNECLQISNFKKISSTE